MSSPVAHNQQRGAPSAPHPIFSGIPCTFPRWSDVWQRFTRVGFFNNNRQHSWPPLPEGHDPDRVWKTIRPGQDFPEPTRVYSAKLPLSAKAPNAVRFVCIADTHGKHGIFTEQLPPGDVLLHAGNFTTLGSKAEIKSFGRWLKSLDFPNKVVIAGAHDMSFHAEYYEGRGRARAARMGDASEFFTGARSVLLEAAGPGVTYLEDESTVIEGVRIHGLPWTPEFNDWAFNLPRGPPIAQKYALVPQDVDVLLTHGPPLGRGDRSIHGNRVGCADLLAEVQDRIQPEFCVCGHIREDYGVSFDGYTHYVNASSCNFDYKTSNAPLVFDVVPTPHKRGMPAERRRHTK